MPKLVLFDIDGTLVLTGGAGVRAMNHAGETVLGVQNLLDGVPIAGRTDWIIFSDALRKIGRELDGALFSRLRAAHIARMREEILHPGEGVKDVLPGVRELLDRLADHRDVVLGLITGNFHDAARVKLEYFDLWRYFPTGAFGDDAADRNALVPIAVTRARDAGSGDIGYSDVVVLGDTPHDITCAQVVGARPIGVATGTYTVQQLVAAGAPVVFEDFSNVDRAMQAILE